MSTPLPCRRCDRGDFRAAYKENYRTKREEFIGWKCMDCGYILKSGLGSIPIKGETKVRER